PFILAGVTLVIVVYFSNGLWGTLKAAGSESKGAANEPATTGHRRLHQRPVCHVSGFAAITNLSMEFRYGEIRAIIGPNGAGKTTLMDVITGKTRPAGGEVFLNKVTNLATLDETSIARLGIGRKFQKPSVFEALRVRENLELAIRNGRGYAEMVRSRLGAQQNRRIDEVLETIGLENEGPRIAGTLSHGQKQWLEIGMLLVADPQVILLDEP
ncbi:ATP-binding cassette domain-containing protein, partial [Paraburkholderia caledonica]|uniref:ATP-binding cassette domain-containing protein n=1 Tax=Paraburkholderia caledonica TaxID=134536 RepID=UPI00211B3CB0